MRTFCYKDFCRLSVEFTEFAARRLRLDWKLCQTFTTFVSLWEKVQISPSCHLLLESFLSKNRQNRRGGCVQCERVHSYSISEDIVITALSPFLH